MYTHHTSETLNVILTSGLKQLMFMYVHHTSEQACAVVSLTMPFKSPFLFMGRCERTPLNWCSHVSPTLLVIEWCQLVAPYPKTGTHNITSQLMWAR